MNGMLWVTFGIALKPNSMYIKETPFGVLHII